jgi:hypothetical protein
MRILLHLTFPPMTPPSHDFHMRKKVVTQARIKKLSTGVADVDR